MQYTKKSEQGKQLDYKSSGCMIQWMARFANGFPSPTSAFLHLKINRLHVMKPKLS